MSFGNPNEGERRIDASEDEVRAIVYPASEQRAVAQMVARFVRDEEVASSNLVSPTKKPSSMSGRLFVLSS